MPNDGVRAKKRSFVQYYDPNSEKCLFLRKRFLPSRWRARADERSDSLLCLRSADCARLGEGVSRTKEHHEEEEKLPIQLHCAHVRHYPVSSFQLLLTLFGGLARLDVCAEVCLNGVNLGSLGYHSYKLQFFTALLLGSTRGSRLQASGLCGASSPRAKGGRALERWASQRRDSRKRSIPLVFTTSQTLRLDFELSAGGCAPQPKQSNGW